MNKEITVDEIESGNKADLKKEEGQAIDLTEIINFDKQNKVMEMTSGMEDYLTGKGLRPTVMKYLKIKMESSKFDPTCSVYNSRFGGEGFFSTVMDGIKTGIVYIINLIKKIVMWCIDKVKQLFGFGNSERQAAVLAEKLPALRDEMRNYLIGLGFPEHIMDLDRFMGTMPAERHRIDQFKCLTYKLKDKSKIFVDIKELLPITNDVISNITNGIKKAARAKTSFDKVLQKMRADIRKGYVQNNYGNELRIAMLEVVKASNFDDQISKIKEMIEKVSGISLEDEDVKTKFTEINERLVKEIVNTTIVMDKTTIQTAEQFIGFFNLRKLDPKTQVDIQLSVKELNAIADLGDLEVISKIAEITGDQEFMIVYQNMMKHLNGYANFTKMSLMAAKDARRIFDELTDWYGKSFVFMINMINNDLDAIKLQLTKMPMRPLSLSNGYTVVA